MSNNEFTGNQKANPEKSSRILLPIYFSVIFLLLTFALILADISTEIQQVIVAMLALILVFTLDAFKGVLSNNYTSSEDNDRIIISSGGMYIAGNYYGGDINNTTEKNQTLAEAALEIQKLLKTLDTINPDATEAEKVAYVNDEVSPDMKSRVASVVKETGESKTVSEIQNLIEANESSEKLLNAVDNKELKQRLAEAIKVGASAAASGIGSNFAFGSILASVIHSWSLSDD
jgi:hypothetical protein